MRRSTVNTQRPGTTLKFDPASTRPPMSISDRRAASGVTRNRVASSSHPPRQRLQAGDDAHRVLERVPPLVQEPDMRLAAVHGDSHADRAAVRVPDDAAGGFRGQHADAVRARRLVAARKPEPRRRRSPRRARTPGRRVRRAARAGAAGPPPHTASRPARSSCRRCRVRTASCRAAPACTGPASSPARRRSGPRKYSERVPEPTLLNTTAAPDASRVPLARYDARVAGQADGAQPRFDDPHALGIRRPWRVLRRRRRRARS